MRIRPGLLVLPILISGLARAETWDHYGPAVDRAQAAGDTTMAPTWQVPLSDAYADSIQTLPGGDVLLVTRGGSYGKAALDAYYATSQGRYWITRDRTCLVTSCKDRDQISHGLRVVDLESRRVAEHLVSAIGFGPVYTVARGSEPLVVADFGMNPHRFPKAVFSSDDGDSVLRPAMTLSGFPLDDFMAPGSRSNSNPHDR